MKPSSSRAQASASAKAASSKSAPKIKVSAEIAKAYGSAVRARSSAHAPYSGFQVGAALMTSSGKVVTGCNVENASYGGTVCAERIAIFKAVSENERRFSDIVIVTDAAEPAFPCAFCLQIMAEFFDPDTRIYLGDLKSIRSAHTFTELLPNPFGPVQLKTAKATATESGKSRAKPSASADAKSGTYTSAKMPPKSKR